MWEIEYDKNKDKEYKLACIRCDGETYHKVLHSVHVHESENEIDVWSDFEIVCCQGCKEVSFRSNSMCSEDINYDPETGEQSLDENVGLYPNRLAGRKQVKDMYLLPDEVLKIYKETHGALCGRLNILAGIGIRALVESVCREKEAQGANLKNKIDDLVTKGVLTQDSAETLHSTRLLGNNSAHETIAASDEELDIAMDIVENLIKTVYVIPQKAKRLNKK
ncbi:MAG: DUF4145 domain-containing protein [Sphingobacteriia bacterium]|jgi:hypothetical protein|nr:DUF4145 domain-containing protein [Sphingobacteriia bacterium]